MMSVDTGMHMCALPLGRLQSFIVWEVCLSALMLGLGEGVLVQPGNDSIPLLFATGFT